MKYEIMFKIMMRLLQKRKVTATDIADRYGVSVRSVYRYIDELIVCGVPIDVTRGRYGGITIPDTFRLPAGYFTREEYAAAINALDAMLSQVYDTNLITAKEKLESRQKSDRREADVCGNIIIDGGTWGGSKPFTEKMQVCEQAVNGSLSLLIDYISREGEHSKRVIDPYVLIFKQNVWYVYAFCHTKQEFRTFKIGRIKSASFTGKTFTKKNFTRDDVDLNFYYPDKQLTEVTFEIGKEILADTEDWLGIENIEPRGKGFIATLSLVDDGSLVNKILSYGKYLKVLSPQSLKEKVASAAKAIADGYGE